ncbi:tyrosine-type recombinase/integrase [Croceibacterium aestuarii]|uniref:tyrosine-type recombinase/integrase n=1 Tax=Croceibacterium aestuarii TaxID=3064139 RepID=UPI00272E2626|nr:site-specific integrase [Croceibacterium sp. D39]
MSLYKPAKSKYWHYDFRFKGHRHHGSTGCTSKRDAERFQSEVRRKAALGEDAKPTIAIDDACGAWYLAKGQHLRSAKTIFYQLDNLAQGLGPTRPLHDITLADLDCYIAKRRGSVKNASVNRETALLRRVIEWHEARDFEAPSIKWKEVKLREPKPVTRTLSAEEEHRLFAALPESLKPIVRFALLSGQRKSEIVTLRWSDVDLAQARATVWAKGGRRHTFPLTPQLIAMIANQPKACAQVFTYVAERSAPRRDDRPQRVKGQRYPFSRQGWDRKWRKALKEAGIEGYRFHDNRHTAATRTGSIEAANQLLGHSDYRTTQRYFHPGEDSVREAMIAAESRNSPEPLDESAENTRKAANDE